MWLLELLRDPHAERLDVERYKLVCSLTLDDGEVDHRAQEHQVHVDVRHRQTPVRLGVEDHQRAQQHQKYQLVDRLDDVVLGVFVGPEESDVQEVRNLDCCQNPDHDSGRRKHERREHNHKDEPSRRQNRNVNPVLFVAFESIEELFKFIVFLFRKLIRR